MVSESLTVKSYAKSRHRSYDQSRRTRHSIEDVDDLDFDPEKDHRDGSLPGGKGLQSTSKVSVESAQSRSLREKVREAD